MSSAWWRATYCSHLNNEISKKLKIPNIKWYGRITNTKWWMRVNILKIQIKSFFRIYMSYFLFPTYVVVDTWLHTLGICNWVRNSGLRLCSSWCCKVIACSLSLCITYWRVVIIACGCGCQCCITMRVKLCVVVAAL